MMLLDPYRFGVAAPSVPFSDVLLQLPHSNGEPFEDVGPLANQLITVGNPVIQVAAGITAVSYQSAQASLISPLNNALLNLNGQDWTFDGYFWVSNFANGSQAGMLNATQNSNLDFAVGTQGGSTFGVFTGGSFPTNLAKSSIPVNTWFHWETSYETSTGRWRAFYNGVGTGTTLVTRNFSGGKFFVGDSPANGGNGVIVGPVRLRRGIAHTSDFTPPARPFPVEGAPVSGGNGWNPADRTVDVTLSSKNRIARSQSTGQGGVRGTQGYVAQSAGSNRYFEIQCFNPSTASDFCGVSFATTAITSTWQNNEGSVLWRSNGQVFVVNSGGSTVNVFTTVGRNNEDVCGFHLTTTGAIQMYLNGVAVGSGLGITGSGLPVKPFALFEASSLPSMILRTRASELQYLPSGATPWET